MPKLLSAAEKKRNQVVPAHLCSHCEPVAAADVSVNLEAHVVGHIVLPHIHQSIQRVLGNRGNLQNRH